MERVWSILSLSLKKSSKNIYTRICCISSGGKVGGVGSRCYVSRLFLYRVQWLVGGAACGEEAVFFIFFLYFPSTPRWLGGGGEHIGYHGTPTTTRSTFACMRVGLSDLPSPLPTPSPTCVRGEGAARVWAVVFSGRCGDAFYSKTQTFSNPSYAIKTFQQTTKPTVMNAHENSNRDRGSKCLTKESRSQSIPKRK